MFVFNRKITRIELEGTVKVPFTTHRDDFALFKQEVIAKASEFVRENYPQAVRLSSVIVRNLNYRTGIASVIVIITLQDDNEPAVET